MIGRIVSVLLVLKLALVLYTQAFLVRQVRTTESRGVQQQFNNRRHPAAFGRTSSSSEKTLRPQQQQQQQQGQQQQQQQATRSQSQSTATKKSTTGLHATLSSSAFTSSNETAIYESELNPDQQQQRQNDGEGEGEGKKKKRFKHALAILTMPHTSVDWIANEAIIETILPEADKLSVVLRCEGGRPPSVSSLRRYVGEVYSQLWDICATWSWESKDGGDDDEEERDGESERRNPDHLPDVVVYPQNLPNIPPESWIHIQRDLDCVCSHDAIAGWVSESATGRGRRYQSSSGDGRGGLKEHVDALNLERRQRDLSPVETLHVDDRKWPEIVASLLSSSPSSKHDDDARYLLFLDDDCEQDGDGDGSPSAPADDDANGENRRRRDDDAAWGEADDEPENELILGGARMPYEKQKLLFHSVVVGGTFDGLHFGHRKLLSLAVSSVHPVTGRLTVGVTVDDMLRNKAYAEYIPTVHERIACVRTFLDRLAPGMINRVKVVPITDSFGPPGQADPKYDFDALVLSHETLETGYQLNRYRKEKLGLEPLYLLCTRRTEAHGMSSTTLRKLRSERKEKEKKKRDAENPDKQQQQQQRQ